MINVVSWYRQQLDRLLAERGLARSSSGHSHVGFEPDHRYRLRFRCTDCDMEVVY